MKYDTIDDIAKRLNKIVKLEGARPLDVLGADIVNCTIVVDGIEKYYTKYPMLQKIGDAGADLQWQGKPFADGYWESIKSNVAKLNKQLEREKQAKN